jgi:hypothetical protein
MENIQEHKARIEEIIRGMECPRDFKCYKSGFEDIPKAEIFNEGELVECLEKNSPPCILSFGFGFGRFCKCHLRRYIAQNFDR